MSTAFQFLRRVSLFADLPDADLEQICERVEEISLKAGEILFEEGSMGQEAYIIREGQIEIYKAANGQYIQLAVRQSGEMIGEISLLEAAPRNASGRALTDSILITLRPEQLDYLLKADPSAARIMLHTIVSRLRSTELRLNQSEKMAQLGTLTAGIAHELNNPSSAVKRGAEQFRAAFMQYMDDTARLHAEEGSWAKIMALQDLERAQAEQVFSLDAVERSDLESELEEWLEEQGIENSWEYAPLLVSMGYQPGRLQQALDGISPSSIPLVIQMITNRYNLYNIIDEISMGAGRISEIVHALKSYVYLDQAPVQSVSVHEGLDNTLVIMRHKLKQGVDLQLVYDPAVPPIQAYGSELNQVWTNLIDNAIDAMDGQGRLTIRTAFKDPWVVVDICDSGPGIPPEIQDKLFSPFFTTKPLGKGTGMGLNISYNIIHKHGGDVKVISQPGETHFEIWLPVDFQKMRESAATLQPVHRLDDNSLRHILDSAHTIAVVGISERPDKPAHSVPAYLQAAGYRILPVNPNLKSVLGEKAYPDLLSIPEPVDVVQVFRASEHVPEIVDQAIAIGARVVWMQEGIFNEAAAQKASQAGLEVVMDACMRNTHRRLYKNT